MATGLSERTFICLFIYTQGGYGVYKAGEHNGCEPRPRRQVALSWRPSSATSCSGPRPHLSLKLSFLPCKVGIITIYASEH